MKLITSLCFLVFLAACSSGSADKKVPELANEMCDCFTNFQKDLSPEAMDLLKKVATSASPQADLSAGIGKLKPEDAVAFSKKFASIGEKGSDVFACMEAFDKKHGKETTKDKKGLTEKLLKEMQTNTNCPVGATVVNLGLSKGAIN
jgi:hypothetical protein